MSAAANPAMLNPTIGNLLDDGAQVLAASADADEATREAQVLLGHSLGVSRAWLSAHRDDSADSAQTIRFRMLLKQRSVGQPVAYLTGKREFYGREFRVTPDVLIPRPDTETLVEAALERLAPKTTLQLLDLGTGSGCIAITLSLERPSTRITAVDISQSALRVARENAQALGARIELLQGVWFGPLDGRQFDLVVSNPPYIAADDPHLQRGDLRFEPAMALAAGMDGLDEIRRIVSGAAAFLKPGGWLLFEHGHDQAGACRDLLDSAGFGKLVSLPDLAGIPRVAGGRLVRDPSSR
ncbi:MAG TPA: peptide chain release factor N(5)-glutamine methyltransferase [Burkholderiales bacterium]|nr:peptide chain release factor N(5)-glutamine methyltransferase [Burkholderiales bacterium]